MYSKAQFIWDDQSNLVSMFSILYGLIMSENVSQSCLQESIVGHLRVQWQVFFPSRQINVENVHSLIILNWSKHPFARMSFADVNQVLSGVVFRSKQHRISSMFRNTGHSMTNCQTSSSGLR